MNNAIFAFTVLLLHLLHIMQEIQFLSLQGDVKYNLPRNKEERKRFSIINYILNISFTTTPSYNNHMISFSKQFRKHQIQLQLPVLLLAGPSCIGFKKKGGNFLPQHQMMLFGWLFSIHLQISMDFSPVQSDAFYTSHYHTWDNQSAQLIQKAWFTLFHEQVDGIR